MKKVLFVASVVKIHIMVFHIPYLKWFKENGYEVHVAAKNDYLNPEELSIPYCDVFHDIDFSRNPLSQNNIKAYKEMKDLLDLNEFEIMHCHTPIGAAIARLAAKYSIHKDLKVIYTAHGFHFYKGAPLINWAVYYPIEKYLSRYTDVLITINEEDYQRARNFKAKEIVLVKGVGFDQSKNNNIININKDDLRRELNIDGDQLVLLSVGELNKNKNHELVIEALSRSSFKDYKYLICGEGPLKASLIELVKNLKMEDNVKFMGFRKDVLKFYKLADIFLFPSYREGLSLSLMEAMSFSLPILASNIRGNIDLIDDAQGGYLFDPKNSYELTHLLDILLTDEVKRKKFGDYNKYKINDYSIENVLNEVVKYYTESE